MTAGKKNSDSTMPSPPSKTSNKRFPKAAQDYIDALLDVQRQRFEKEAASVEKPSGDWPSLPLKLHLLAEADNFIGSGWGDVDSGGSRWIARIGTVLFSADTSGGGQLEISGSYLKKAFVDEMSIWLDDQPVAGKLRWQRGRRWSFHGETPHLSARPYHILKLQTTRMRKDDRGPESHASLAVGEIKFSANT